MYLSIFSALLWFGFCPQVVPFQLPIVSLADPYQNDVMFKTKVNKKHYLIFWELFVLGRELGR